VPYDEVLHKFKHGTLHSGSGDKVTDRKQAVAIMLSEKRKAGAGKNEYKSRAEHVHRRHRKLIDAALEHK